MISRAAILKAACCLLLFPIVVYLFTLSFPQPFFAYHSSFRNLTVYSHQPPDANTEQIMKRVSDKLDASGINDPSIDYYIYLCRSYGEFAYFANRHYAVFGLSYPIIDNIFVNKSDPASNAVDSSVYHQHSRTLAGVLTHEAVHVLMRKRYGLLTEQQMPLWKREGYPDYVSGETFLNYQEGMRMLRESPADDLSALEAQPYFKYYLMVRYLIEVKGLNTDAVVGTEFDEKALEKEVAKNFRNP